jgi:ribosomal protein S18 acetylase RimI-like enzyme
MNLARAGAQAVTLNTPESNAASQALYAGLGFRVLAERPRLLRKTLTPREEPRRGEPP